MSTIRKKISELLPVDVISDDFSRTLLVVAVDNTNNLSLPAGLRIISTKKITLQQLNEAVEREIPITSFMQASFNTANLAFSNASSLSNLSSIIFNTANTALERVNALEGVPSFFVVEYSEQEITSNFSFRENSVSTSRGIVAIGKNVTVELVQSSTWILDN
jgi:hypothetical protein